MARSRIDRARAYAAAGILPWVTSGAGIAWLTLVAIAADRGISKLLVISIAAALAMLAGAGCAHGRLAPRFSGAIDGLASGAMLASAFVYLIPTAVYHHPFTGSIGVAAGLASTYTIYRLAPTRGHEAILGALCLHALTAGLVMGLIYAQMPALGLAAGLAIVSHKLPAGYVLARSLQHDNRFRYGVLLPATGVGLTGLPIALWRPRLGLPHGLLFGLASGLFIAVAWVYIENMHTRRDQKQARQRVVSAVLAGGALVVSLAWATRVLG